MVCSFSNSKLAKKTSELSRMSELVVDLQKELDHYKLEHGERVPANAPSQVSTSHNMDSLCRIEVKLANFELN